MQIRNLMLGAATATAIAGLAAAPAVAAPHVHAHIGKGFLSLTVAPAAAVFLPPGQAVHAAQAACANVVAHPPLVAAPVGTVLVQPGDLTVDAVRGAFPTPVAVCTGVTLTSQVATEAVDVAEVTEFAEV
jgi:hypothetical protein